MEPSDIVDQFWRRIQARDWDAVGELLAEDFVLEWPNARICIRGRTNFVEFNRSYPEGWSIEVLRIVAEGNTALTGSSRCDDPAAGASLRECHPSVRFANRLACRHDPQTCMSAIRPSRLVSTW